MSRKRPDRTVVLEFLRPGPPHNQLLSPLTPYLAVCGEAGATVLNVPWEHAPFERRLEGLRYESGYDEEPSRRLALLDEMGREIGQLLGSIPALSGVLSVDKSRGTPDVTHMRIVLSASELGLIPYELSKAPSGLQMPADNWLLLQVHVPICLTRHIRSVPYEYSGWDRAARVLFVAADPDNLPFEQHREELLAAVDPWLGPKDINPADSIPGVSCNGQLEVYGKVLTIIKDAKLEDIKNLCREGDYSHVHVLAHGGEDETTDYRSFGVGLGGEIVTGTRFASALTTTQGSSTTQPTFVSLATCDSANVGSVVRAGASFAHALHQSGIPLVVASQFPLSFDGSIVALRRMYTPHDGFLWGASHPIRMLHDVRRELLIENEVHSHDWASLVVYEALPANLENQLDAYQYHQSYSAVKAGESHLKQAVSKLNDQSLDKCAAALAAARQRCAQARDALPQDGPYAMEALGIKASNFKTNAEASFQFAMATSAQQREEYLGECHQDLERAFDEYRKAAECFLRLREARAQLNATLHWVLVQALSMGTVLGRDIDADYWGIGRRAARAYLQDPATDERAWAYGSLAELSLLRLANEKLSAAERKDISTKAVETIHSLIELYPERGAWQIASTDRQFGRYVTWWGNKVFTDYLTNRGIKRRQDWGDSHGVLATAKAISESLKMRMWT